MLPHSKACAGRNHGWRLAVIELLQQLAGVYASTGQTSAALQTYQECVDMQVCSRRFPPVLQIVDCDPVTNAEETDLWCLIRTSISNVGTVVTHGKFD